MGTLAIILKGKSGQLRRRDAEIAALTEAVRNANDGENTDKVSGTDWVFLQGKAVFHRWAEDLSTPDKERGPGDAYCIDFYASCHARAEDFLREISGNYPGAENALKNAALYSDREAACLIKLVPLLHWSSPWGVDAARNAAAHPLLRDAYEASATAMDILETAPPSIVSSHIDTFR